MSPEAQPENQKQGIHFQASLENEQDISRLIAYLKEENMLIGNLIHNQPYMLKPTPPDSQINESDEDGLRA